MVNLEQLVAAAAATFADDDVLLGTVVDSTIRFVGGTPPNDKQVWSAISAVLASGAPEEVRVDDVLTYVLPLFSSEAVNGVLLLRRSGGPLTGEERTTAAFTAGRLSASLAGLQAFDRLDTLLRQYMPFDVAMTLVREPQQGSLGGQRQDVTVLFADLRGYTSYSERYSPEDVVAMLNRYFEIVVPVLTNHGGTVTSFIGDAVMAIFNAPVAQPEHALLAARAGLAMQEAIEHEISSRPGWPLFRVGLHTGPALVGNIGSQQRRTYTAIGDTTNVASRLEGLAEPGRVVISGESLRAIGAASPLTRPLGAVAVKGRIEPVEAHVLEGFSDLQPGGRHTTSLPRSALGQLTTDESAS
jgi:class 3 adenylate cyclase